MSSRHRISIPLVALCPALEKPHDPSGGSSQRVQTQDTLSAPWEHPSELIVTQGDTKPREALLSVLLELCVKVTEGRSQQTCRALSHRAPTALWEGSSCVLV